MSRFRLHVRPRLLACGLAVALATTAVGCGGDDDGDETTPTVAEGEIVDSKQLVACLRNGGLVGGEPGADAVLAPYAKQAVAAGGDTFVIEDPISQVIVFPEPVNLAEAEDELLAIAARSGGRATGLQADAYGNVIIVYFNPQGAVKTDVNACLPAPAEAVPGLAAPYASPGLAPGVTQ